MQDGLTSRIERLWAMADIAARHGFARSTDIQAKPKKTVEFGGLSFLFLDGALIQVESPHLAVNIAHHQSKPDPYERFFGMPLFKKPGIDTIVHFSRGDDQVLNRSYRHLLALAETIIQARAA